MTLLRNETGVATLARALAPLEGVAQSGPEDQLDRDDAMSMRQQREIIFLAHHLLEDHPGVALAELTSLVEHEYAALERSRVQGFRMILTERAVRRRLASSRDQASI